MRQQERVLSALDGFSEYMDGIVREWNVPGIGIGIVKDDTLVFSRGYGYRNYAEQLPFTASTVFPIASDTKLFTAIACGLLVEDGLLTYDEPIRDRVPGLRFSTDALNQTVTLRDSTFILREILDSGGDKIALGPLWGPVAVRFAMEAGAGAHVALRIGGKTGPGSGERLDVRGTVTAIRRGYAADIWSGRQRSYGDSVALRLQGEVDVLLTSLRGQAFSRAPGSTCSRSALLFANPPIISTQTSLRSPTGYFTPAPPGR